MKKILVLFTALTAALTVSAQQKGSFSVGGTFGITGGVQSISIRFDDDSKTTASAPTAVKFGLSPRFNYFVIDNLELNTGLEYALQRDFIGTDSDDKNLYQFTNTALFVLGAHYFVPIVKNVLYYTPGIDLGFGGGSIIEQSSRTNSDKTKIPFAFGCGIDLGKFEFKPTNKIGVTLNVFSMAVATVKSNDIVATSFATDLAYSSSIGVKYYFK